MEKKHYIQIAICSLIVLISSILFTYYYQTYIAPESYVIGSVEFEDYTSLPIKDYISDENVIFSQNINDVTFAKVDSIATYEYNFDHKDFNGVEKDYIIYVNNYMINTLEENAGTIGGVYKLNYYNTEKQVLCSSDINIDFSFYSLRSTLKVTLNYSDIGYLMKYFESDNFIVTLAENPYSMMDKNGEVDEKIQEIISLTNKVNELSEEISILNKDINQHLQDIAELTQSNQENTAEIRRLEAELSQSQAEVTRLTNELILANNEIERLTAENNEIISENTALKEVIETQKTTIATLNQTITDLEYQVSYYEQLLEAYKNSNKLSVSFKVDNESINVQLVNVGDFAIQPVNPTKNSYDFKGWSVDGVNIIDVTNYTITENTTFIALFELNMNGTFVYDSHEVVIKDGQVDSWLVDGNNRTIQIGFDENYYVSFDAGEGQVYFILKSYDMNQKTWIMEIVSSFIDGTTTETHLMTRIFK